MRKFKVGKWVRASDSMCAEYRSNIMTYFSVMGKINPDATSAALMWAMSDFERPAGRVIEGSPAYPDEDVRVSLKNRFGEYEGYVAKDELLVRGWVE